jgi:hypothetical protein
MDMSGRARRRSLRRTLIRRSLRDRHPMLLGIKRRHHIVEEDLTPASDHRISRCAAVKNASDSQNVGISSQTRRRPRDTHTIPLVVSPIRKNLVPRVNAKRRPAHRERKRRRRRVAGYHPQVCIGIVLRRGLKPRQRRRVASSSASCPCPVSL